MIPRDYTLRNLKPAVVHMRATDINGRLVVLPIAPNTAMLFRGWIEESELKKLVSSSTPVPPTPQPIDPAVEKRLASKADLDAGKLRESQLPELAVSRFLGVVDSEGEMLELVAQTGDWCFRADTGTYFKCSGESGDPENWHQQGATSALSPDLAETAAAGAATQAAARGNLAAGATGDKVFQAATPLAAQAEVLMGAGNLHEWFDRQFSHITNTTEVGKSKRVHMCNCGDSLGGRLAGFWQIWAREEYTKDGNGIAIDPNGQLVFNPGSFQAPAGPNTSLTGDAALVTNGFALWPSGRYYDVGPGGTLRWDSSFAKDCTLVKIYYVAEPGAGTFSLETASSAGGPYTAIGSQVDTSNVTQVGAVYSLSVAHARRFVRLTNDHATARLKIIGVYLGYPNDVQGYDSSMISQGGISVAQFTSASLDVVTPILADLNPALITYHCDDGPTDVIPNWDALIAVLRAGNSNRSILIICNGPRQSGGDANMATVRDFIRSRVDIDKIAMCDLFAAIGPWAQTEMMGWQGDGIHLSPRAYAYGAALAWQHLSIGSRMGPLAASRGHINELWTASIRGDRGRAGFIGTPDSYYFGLFWDTTNQVGGRIEFSRDFFIRDVGNTNTVISLSTNEAVTRNQYTARGFWPNASNDTRQASYTSQTTGIAYWVFNGRFALESRATGQIVRVGPYTGEASLDYPSIDAGAEATLTVPVDGVTVAGKFTCTVGWSAALEDGLVMKQAWVSATNTVSIRLRNASGSAIDPAAVTAYVACLRIA